MNERQDFRGTLTIKALELLHRDLAGMQIDAHLKPGDFMVVVGRNGAGKSTLLHTVMGLLSPLRGEVMLGPDDVFSLSPRERATRMSFVTSTPPRHAGITVRETIELALKAGSTAVDADVAEAHMEATGIRSWADRRLDRLSDGMAQRVMVARAAIQSRHTMVLDEPTAFLDVVGKEDVLEQLGQWKEKGRIIVLATHDLEAVAACGGVTHWLHLRPGISGGSTFHQGGFEPETVRAVLRAEKG